MAEMVNGRLAVFGNQVTKGQTKAALKWQKKFIKMFNYDPEEKYVLSAQDNQYLGPLFGLKNIVRSEEGEPIDKDKAVILSTIRMGFGHYRIAMAGMSAAKAMGFTPYWLDLLAIPGITTQVIKWCNDNYSYWSRVSQKSNWFNENVWEAITTGEHKNPIVKFVLEKIIETWNWRHIKTNVKDYKMSELFRNLYEALPSDMPTLTAHMWNCMGAVAGGMENVVDMVFDNWPMSFQLTEGAIHGIQSPSGYYGFRVMNNFGDKGRIMKPVPPSALEYVGHHVDHELVLNIEEDCRRRVQRMEKGEPRRFLITMGGAGAQRELFSSVIEHMIPLIQKDKAMLFVNLGDHKNNWEWLEKELRNYKDLITTHFTWEDTQKYADSIRDGKASGLHIFLYDNIYHAVYATNYLMRVVDVMITKPSELAFYPIPKIFNARVGGHEMWGAVRGAEIGDSTIECKTIPATLQAIDVITEDKDLLSMYCDMIVKNKSIGIYDGAYKCVALATGQEFDPSIRNL
ncbi:MAG: DUF6938 domain-containing protein [Spirochaetia bacterium]